VGADLLSTIHEEIIPRLMMAHTTHPLPQLCADARLPPTPEEVLEFAKLCIREDLSLALSYIEKMCADGLSLEAVLLDLVAPSARALGDEWVADNTSFTEVTAGLCTLQQVVHTLGPSFAPPAPHRGSIVLASVQPEQHTLGIFLLGEFLRREGWGVHVAPTMPEPELLSLVGSQHIEVVGLSVGNTGLLGPLGALLRKLKKVSLNRKIGVLLGGPLPLDEYAKEHGVSCCSDPRDAVQWVENHAISIMRGRNGARRTGRGTRSAKQ
jgi:methanogenic corrinoid protein MtbC1